MVAIRLILEALMDDNLDFFKTLFIIRHIDVEIFFIRYQIFVSGWA